MATRAHTKASGIIVATMALALCGCRSTCRVTPRAEPRRADSASTGQRKIYAYYLIPKDCHENPIYAYAIRKALTDLQNWFREAMKGKTFRLADPIVSAVRLPHPVAYYSIHPNGDDCSLWFWNNVLDDAVPLTGGNGLDDRIRLYYIDADRMCIQVTGGNRGVAVLPANDLRGLVGEPTKAICAGELQYPVSRYIGGSGHELGHALGLDHPPGCDESPPVGDTQALMCLGYFDYPKTHLTKQDIEQLQRSDFFH